MLWDLPIKALYSPDGSPPGVSESTHVRKRGGEPVRPSACIQSEATVPKPPTFNYRRTPSTLYHQHLPSAERSSSPSKNVSGIRFTDELFGIFSASPRYNSVNNWRSLGPSRPRAFSAPDGSSQAGKAAASLHSSAGNLRIAHWSPRWKM